MLLLSSSAFEDPLLFPFCLSRLNLVAGAVKTSVLISASPQKEKGPNAVKTLDFLRGQGASNGRFVDLFDGPEALKELEQSDLVVINGGNPFLLLQAVQQCNAREALGRLAQTKVVVAVSAGGMLFSPGLHHVEAFNAMLGFENKGNPGLTELGGLDWFGEYFFPHFAQFSAKTPGLEVQLREFERHEGVVLYRQNNGETARVENRVIRPLNKEIP